MSGPFDGGQNRAVSDLRAARTGAAGWRDGQRAAFERAHLDALETSGARFAEALTALATAIADAERSIED